MTNAEEKSDIKEHRTGLKGDCLKEAKLKLHFEESAKGKKTKKQRGIYFIQREDTATEHVIDTSTLFNLRVGEV